MRGVPGEPPGGSGQSWRRGRDQPLRARGPSDTRTPQEQLRGQRAGRAAWLPLQDRDRSARSRCRFNRFSRSQDVGIQKQNCTWLLVTHETCDKGDVMTALEKATGDVVLKFEPFVLHVQCQELQDAQLLHSVAVNSGFRNSGITVGKGGKIMMAVRSTHCLEVPLCHKGKLMVSEEYIEFLINVANQKMEENIKRINRFYERLESALNAAVSANSSSSQETGKNRSVYVHRRKRKTIQEQGVCTSPEDHNTESEPQDGAESSLDIFAEIMIAD
ncbi:hypothetical protein A306_00004185 [Columba livia]|uniref:tRNA wybutosine-synthesizing protein 3 homolog n=2 Tax=Columba livia TaxID=8932 RepID=A0A2I0MCH1_COLLI|nr:hypothetical protein A306_00004185 [Columba livia]